MAIKYNHSHVMSVVKNTTERIKKNYSSSQYIEVLDILPDLAIAPILESCDYADQFVSGILHHSVENTRRKLSSTERNELLPRCVLFLSATPSKKLPIYKSLRLERSITRLILEKFLAASDKYESYKLAESLGTASPEDIISRKNIEYALGFNKSLDLICVRKTVNYWHDKYKSFREQVLNKFMRFITVQAQAFYAQNNSSVDLDELLQNYIMYSAKAVDKFDPRQGTLTSYIKNWLSHARNVTTTNESGTSFVLPSAKRSSGINNRSLSIDDDSVKEIFVEDGRAEVLSDVERVRKLSRLADPVGLARLSMDIEEYNYPHELKLLQHYATK